MPDFFSTTSPSPPLKKGGWWLVGNYDGFHLGHQALVAATKKRDKPVHLLTFTPHPRRFFQPDTAPFRLTSAQERERLARAAGVEQVLCLPFNAELAALTAEAFVQSILIELCGAEGVVVGQDFHFGAHRKGNVALLQTLLGADAVDVVPPVVDDHGLPYSSSRVRQALADGDMPLATKLLGRAWNITGKVEQGEQKGRTIGFPTANIDLGESLRPRFGVYAVTVDGYSTGIANIGTRPTVGGTAERLEVHLLSGSPNLYGETLTVHLHHFIRPEQRFSSLDALKEQIKRDVEAVRL